MTGNENEAAARANECDDQPETVQSAARTKRKAERDATPDEVAAEGGPELRTLALPEGLDHPDGMKTQSGT